MYQKNIAVKDFISYGTYFPIFEKGKIKNNRFEDVCVNRKLY